MSDPTSRPDAIGVVLLIVAITYWWRKALAGNWHGRDKCHFLWPHQMRVPIVNAPPPRQIPVHDTVRFNLPYDEHIARPQITGHAIAVAYEYHQIALSDYHVFTRPHELHLEQYVSRFPHRPHSSLCNVAPFTSSEKAFIKLDM